MTVLRGGVLWLAAAGLLVGCFPELPPLEEEDTAVSPGDGEDAAEVDPDTSEPPEDTGPSEDTAAPEDTRPQPDGDAPECVTATDCEHLAATCTQVVCLAGSCAVQPTDGAPCDDRDPCTRDDTCAGFTCRGQPYTCDDGIACTADVCDGQGGCTYPAAEGFCHIGGACYAAGTVKSDDACRICEGGRPGLRTTVPPARTATPSAPSATAARAPPAWAARPLTTARATGS